MADLTMDLWLKAHDDFSSTFEKMGLHMEGLRGKIGLLAGGFGLLAGGVLAESVKEASKFESTTQALANNTNMGAAGLAAMRDAALKLSAATGQDAERIAEGYMHIANHAYSGAAAMNIATAATKNAAATNGDAAEDANVLAGVLREYNVQQKDLARNTDLATRYMDVMHNAVANSNFTMKDFAEGSKRAIATAGNFHVPLSQVTAQLAVLSEHGFPSAHVAALNWAGMLRSLEGPTAKGLKAMQSLSHATGVDLVGDIKKLQKDGAFLPQFLADIQKATGGDFNKIRAIMPQSSYATALMALTRNHEELAKAQRMTGAAEAGTKTPGMVGTNEAFAAQQKTLNGQMADLKQTVKDTSIVIGTALIPAINKLLHAVMPIVQQVAAWISHHQKLTAQILAATAVLGTFVGAMMILGPAFAAVREATTLWTAAQWLLNAALDANPIGLIVIGIAAAVAAVYLLVTHWRQVSAFLSTIWSGIVDAAGQLWQWLTGIWNGVVGDAQLIWEQLGEWLSGTWNGIVSFASAIWGHVVDFFKTLWNGVVGIWQGFWNTIGTWLKGAWDGISGAATAVWTGVTGFLGGLWDGISAAWNGTWSAIGALLNGAWSGIVASARTVWGGISGFFGNLWAGISAGWGGFWTALGTLVHGLWTDITTDATTVWGGIKGFFNNVWGPISAGWSGFWTGLGTLLHGWWTDITADAGKVWGAISGFFGGVWGTIRKDWQGFWDGIGTLLHNAWTTIKNTATGDWNAVTSLVSGIWGGISAAWTKIWGTTKSDLEKTWKTIKDWVKHAWDGTVGSVKKIWDDVHTAWTTKWNEIKDVFTGKNGLVTWIQKHLVDAALDWGKNMVSNLADGIKSAPGNALKAIQGLMAAIAKFLTLKSPAEEGPLSRMPDFGYVADAMRLAIPQVRAASAELAAAAGMGGGGFALGAGGSAGGAHTGVASSLAGAGARPVVNLNLGGITVQGGTFTDKRGVSDLAEKVSEEIMHKVRMQGGLLPQI